MAKQIWKYRITPYYTSIGMPKGAEVLTVQTQNGCPCMWAMVDSDQRIEVRTFQAYGTGHALPDTPTEKKYIGTFQMDVLVFHLFELVNPNN